MSRKSVASAWAVSSATCAGVAIGLGLLVPLAPSSLSIHWMHRRRNSQRASR